MITIYRIQDREGRGPYRPGFSQAWGGHLHVAPERPSWIEEYAYPVKAGNKRIGIFVNYLEGKRT